MNPIKKKLVKAVQQELGRSLRDINGKCPDNMLAINAAQNTLRTCIEAVLQQLTPYEGVFLNELAIRLASYAISAAPIEDQEVLVAQFMGVFANAHMQRISEGKIIQTEWRMEDGTDKPNFPGGPTSEGN